MELSVQGLTAVLLSLKKKPVIRYERMSGMAKKLAVEVQVRVLFLRDEAGLKTNLRVASDPIRIPTIRLPPNSSPSATTHS